MFGDVSNYKNEGDWLYLVTGAVVVDLVVIFMSKYLGQPVLGIKTLNDWYTQFGLLAAGADILSVLMGLFFARLIYAQLGGPIWVFIASILGFQLFHDVLFYLGVILPLPKGENAMIDVFKAYAVENGHKILFADAAIMLGSVGVASFLKALRPVYTTGTLLVALYALCYILYTKSA